MIRVSFATLLILLAAAVGCGSDSSVGPRPLPSITKVSGDAQEVLMGQTEPAPLVVSVTDANGAPVIGTKVSWGVVSGGGSLSATSSITDQSGNSTVTWTLGDVGEQTVKAWTDLAGTQGVIFSANGLTHVVTVVSGDAQKSFFGSTLLAPLVVAVTTSTGAVAANVKVNWGIVAGGGSLSAASSITDHNGIASTTWTLGPEPSVNQAVKAWTDVPGSHSASFSATATRPSPVYLPSLFFLLTPGNGSATVAYDLPLPFLDRPWLVTVTCNAAGSPATTTSRVDSVVSFITITGLQNGVNYSCSYSITSASGVVTSAQRDVVPGTPVRPLDPRATPGNGSVTLSFQPAADNGSPVIGYTATCIAPGQVSETVNGPSGPLVVTGLTNGVEYSCSVYASNALGRGENSAPLAVTTGRPGPVKSITVTTTSNSATVSFSPPDSDNGSPITSYTFVCNPFGPPPATSVTGTTSPLTLTGLSANAAYACGIFATNANGNGVSTGVSVTITP